MSDVHRELYSAISEEDARVRTAILEAERFVQRAMAHRRRLAAEGEAYGFATAERAAMRRASMDLTRALADVRRRSP